MTARLLKQAIRSATRTLDTNVDAPETDAQILLSHVLDRSRAWILAHPDEELDEDTLSRYDNLVRRVSDGEALPYVLGERWFYGREFLVEPSVLIPRPETELLVEMALDYLHENRSKRHGVDVGTGSGCIAVSLCSEVKDLEMLAVDRAEEAVRVARKNAERMHVVDRIQFVVADLLTPVVGKYDLICANLPYIPRKRLSALDVAKKEPIAALDGGQDGLELIWRLLEGIEGALNPGGRLLLEIDATQSSALLDRIVNVPGSREISIRKDLADLDRLLILDMAS